MVLFPPYKVSQDELSTAAMSNAQSATYTISKPVQGDYPVRATTAIGLANPSLPIGRMDENVGKPLSKAKKLT